HRLGGCARSTHGVVDHVPGLNRAFLRVDCLEHDRTRRGITDHDDDTRPDGGDLRRRLLYRLAVVRVCNGVALVDVLALQRVADRGLERLAIRIVDVDDRGLRCTGAVDGL